MESYSVKQCNASHHKLEFNNSFSLNLVTQMVKKIDGKQVYRDKGSVVPEPTLYGPSQDA